MRTNRCYRRRFGAVGGSVAGKESGGNAILRFVTVNIITCVSWFIFACESNVGVDKKTSYCRIRVFECCQDVQ
jgi:hypothetical protein